MKNILILLVSMIITFNVSAHHFIDGKQYFTLEQSLAIEAVGEILEFFSFYCLPCYHFNEVLHITDLLKKELPKNIKITKFHVNTLGSLGRELTRAWAVAITLGIEDKIFKPMFEAVQKSQNIHTVNDIRKIFIDIGIKDKDYDAAWNSFTVKTLVVQQENIAEYLKVDGAPAMFVKGKYKINPHGIDASSVDNFVTQYINTVKYLIDK